MKDKRILVKRDSAALVALVEHAKRHGYGVDIIDPNDATEPDSELVYHQTSGEYLRSRVGQRIMRLVNGLIRVAVFVGIIYLIMRYF